jgi:hypothetical protein
MNTLIALLSYDCKIDCAASLSLTQNVRYLDKRNYDVQVHYEVKNCYLPIARNKVVETFLKSDATDLVFMDADLVFDVAAIYNLLQHDVDIVAAIYPYKVDPESYPVRIINNPNGTAHVENGLIEAIFVPTGLMRIRRNVIETMITKYPNLILTNGQHTLFDTGDLWHEGTWHGEDVTFCRRWREIGGRIWILPDIDIAHIGSKEYIGNYHKFLLKQPRPS